MKMRVKIDQETYEVEISNLNSRPILATVDGQTFEVWPDEAAAVSAAAPAVAAAAPAAPVVQPVVEAAPAPAVKPAARAVAGKNTVNAPIPGVIISIAVKEGEAVKANQELCILEAMKMKNTIRADRDGTIGAILVAAGENVKHNQPLMEYAA